MHQSKKQSAGFTLVELTIATAILSAILVVITQVFIGLIRENIGAISVQNSTQNARNAIDDITTQARLSDHIQVIPNNFDSSTATPPNFDQICLYQGTTLVQYFAINKVVTIANNQVDQRILYRYTTPYVNNTYVPTFSGAFLICRPITNVPAGAVEVISSGYNSTTGAADSNNVDVGVSDFEAQVSPEIVPGVAGHNALIAAGAIPTLTVRIGITTNLIQQYPNTASQCTAGFEYCSISTLESSISLRETQSPPGETSTVQSTGL